MSTDPDVADTPASDIEFGVQWTPALGGVRVENSPISEAHATRLAQSLAVGQGLSGIDPDAAVVYRVPGGEWSAIPPGAASDALLEEFLAWLKENPDAPQAFPYGP